MESTRQLKGMKTSFAKNKNGVLQYRDEKGKFSKNPWERRNEVRGLTKKGGLNFNGVSFSKEEALFDCNASWSEDKLVKIYDSGSGVRLEYGVRPYGSYHFSSTTPVISWSGIEVNTSASAQGGINVIDAQIDKGLVQARAQADILSGNVSGEVSVSRDEQNNAVASVELNSRVSLFDIKGEINNKETSIFGNDIVCTAKGDFHFGVDVKFRMGIEHYKTKKGNHWYLEPGFSSGSQGSVDFDCNVVKKYKY